MGDELEMWWRPVSEALPGNDSDVVVAYRDRYTGFVKYGVASYDEGCWFSESDDIDRSCIMAWCPIPRYTGKEEEE